VKAFVGVFGLENPGTHTLAVLCERGDELHSRVSTAYDATTPKAWTLAVRVALDAIAPWEQATIFVRDLAFVQSAHLGREYPGGFPPGEYVVAELHRRGLAVAWSGKSAELSEHERALSDRASAIAREAA